LYSRTSGGHAGIQISSVDIAPAITGLHTCRAFVEEFSSLRIAAHANILHHKSPPEQACVASGKYCKNPGSRHFAEEIEKKRKKIKKMKLK